MTVDAPTGAGNVTTATQSAGTGVTGSKPTNTANGDQLIAWVYSSLSSATITPPGTGWVQLGGQNVVRSAYVFRKPIPSAAAETATSYLFGWSGGSGRGFVVLFRVTGADATTPIDVVGTLTAAGTPPIVADAVTVTGTARLLLGFWYTNTATTTPAVITPPGTEIGNVTIAPASSSYGSVSKETLTGAGNTGTRSATVSPSPTGGIGGMLVAVAPTASSGAPTGVTPFQYSSNRVDLSWNAVSGAVSYMIERDGVTIASNVVGTTYSDLGVAPMNTYTYRVMAQL